MRIRARWIAVAAAAVVAINVGAAVLDSVLGGPGGPRSSAYATAGDGLAAYAELLGRFGHRVALQNAFPVGRALDSRSTVVLLDADTVLPAQARALARFVEAGGRLVAGGAPPGAWLSQVIGRVPRWSPVGPADPVALLARPETRGVATLASAGDGSFTRPGAATPIVGRGGHSLALAAVRGRGETLLLADASALQNRLLARADNATFGVALAGPPSRPVVFVEAVHGYGRGRGLGALPIRWRDALVGLAAALIAWMAARGRRLGPPEPPVADPPPPRSAYVDALAGTLARATDRPEAGEPVRRAARELIARRSGLGADCGAEVLASAGRSLGLDEADTRALAQPAHDEAGVVAVGRAFARLHRGGGSTP